jgi:hypothetical protein
MEESDVAQRKVLFRHMMWGLRKPRNTLLSSPGFEQGAPE